MKNHLGRIFYPTFQALLVITFFLTLTSCEGQKAESPKTQSQFGTEISALGQSASRIFEDSKGRYWFASDGAVCYDGQKMIRYTTDDGLKANRIRGFREGADGRIYFDSGEGISVFDENSIKPIDLAKPPFTTDAYGLGFSDIWFEGNWSKNGAYRFDGVKLYHIELPEHPAEAEFHELNPSASFIPYDVYYTFRDSKQNVWIGTSTFGACRYDGKSFKWLSEREMTELDPGPAPGVRCIVEDQDGYFWFNSNLNHKYRILETDESNNSDALQYEKLPGIDTAGEKSLPPYVMAMAQSADGTFWLAQYSGRVWTYRDGTLKPIQVTVDGITAEIFSIYVDHHDKVWIGTHNVGALYYDGKKFTQFMP